MQNKFSICLKGIILLCSFFFMMPAKTTNNYSGLAAPSGHSALIKMPAQQQDVLLAVMVSDAEGKPVRNATVLLQQEDGKELKRQLTDETGIVSFMCQEGKTYRVRVEHVQYAAAEQLIAIEEDRKESYFLDMTLKKRSGQDKNATRSLKVTVVDAATNKPVANALVVAEGRQGHTNGSGIAFFQNILALGERGTVRVSPTGYQSEERSYVAGGDQYHYAFTSADELVFSLKKAGTGKVTLAVQVLDHATAKGIYKADVTVTNNAGKIVFRNSSNAKGEVAYKVMRTELENGPFRVKATAKGYDEKWSDITSDFLHLGNDPIFFTMHLAQSTAKATGKEKKYGPFYVPSGQWVSTGITFKKGDYFRVEATGYFTAKDGQHIGPEGGGYWTWWTLAGQIGKQRMYLGRGNGATVTEGDVLELGTPRGLGSKEFVKEDVENLRGKLTVFVYSKAGVQDTVERFVTADVQRDIHLLESIRDKDEAIYSGREYDEITGELMRIYETYHLSKIKSRDGYSIGNCCNWLAVFMNNDTPNKEFLDCINTMIRSLRLKLK